MKYLKTYEKFRGDIDVLEPKTKKNLLIDEPIDPSLLKDDEEDIKDNKSYIDSRGIIHIKNWKVY